MKEKYYSCKQAWEQVIQDHPYVTYTMLLNAIKRGDIRAFKTTLSPYAKYRLLVSDAKKYYQHIEEQEINF